MPKLLLIERINTQLAMHSLHLSVPHEIYLDGKIEIYTAISDPIKKQHIIKDMELFILDKYCINLLLDDYVIYSKNRHAFWNNLLDWVPTNTGASGISLEHQIETHSPSVWVQSEGVSLITDLSLSKKNLTVLLSDDKLT